MSDKSGIEWTDATWNPVTGCTEVSPGCDHCYAKTFAERWRGVPGHHFEQGFDVVLRPERLDQPIRWKKPRRIFVNSMSDLFHASIPDGFIGAVFDVMARAPQHTFQVLTKRHGRMRSLLNDWATQGIVVDSGYLFPPHRQVGASRTTAPLWTPPPNVWVGVSVEDQKWTDIRIPALLDTPAAVRFLSCEPLLGPVDLIPPLERWAAGRAVQINEHLHWVIVGGESGHGARPMHPDWARSLRDQCTAAGVAFHFKQWGNWAPHRLDGGTHTNGRLSKTRNQYESHRFAPDGTAYRANEPDLYSYPGMASMLHVGKKSAGRVLDGRTWDEFPELVPA